MAESSRKRTCFVVMPFGEKKDLDGQDIDFNDIYEYFFKKTVEVLNKIEKLEIECTRCDEIDESGSIHEKMFEHIYLSDIVVVDITTSNANVYYELGIRHALAKNVTVLIRRKATTPYPFNIQGLQVVEYDPSQFRSIEMAQDADPRDHQAGPQEPEERQPGPRGPRPEHRARGQTVGETKYFDAAIKFDPSTRTWPTPASASSRETSRTSRASTSG